MAERRSNINWDDRYDKRSQELHKKNWSEISLQVRQTTSGKCCLCDRASSCTHHACYFGPYRAGVDLFGLCDACHTQAHLAKNWRRYRYKGVWRNKNTPQFYKRLRQGWLDKYEQNKAFGRGLDADKMRQETYNKMAENEQSNRFNASQGLVNAYNDARRTNADLMARTLQF